MWIKSITQNSIISFRYQPSRFLRNQGAVERTIVALYEGIEVTSDEGAVALAQSGIREFLPARVGEVVVPVSEVAEIVEAPEVIKVAETGTFIDLTGSISSGMAEELSGISQPCPLCGATGDEPCLTTSGNVASRHSVRE